jgi:ABC-2 type transport system permease protein
MTDYSDRSPYQGRSSFPGRSARAGRAGARPPARRRAMNPWRLEWLRLVRTPRALALGAVFVFLGLIEPAGTKYESQILRHVGNGVRISFPPPTPAAGINSYVSELNGIGLILVVVLAAGAFTFDARHGIATFLRTRVTSMWQLVAPRFAVNAAAAAVAYLLGSLAAWYETDLLIGSPATGGMLAGILCGCLYFTFVVAVTCAASSVVRGTLGTIGLTVVVLLVLPIAGTFRAIDNWLPSTLAGAPADLLAGTRLSHYVPAFGVTVAAIAALLTFAVIRLRAREV